MKIWSDSLCVLFVGLTLSGCISSNESNKEVNEVIEKENNLQDSIKTENNNLDEKVDSLETEKIDSLKTEYLINENFANSEPISIQVNTEIPYTLEDGISKDEFKISDFSKYCGENGSSSSYGIKDYPYEIWNGGLTIDYQGCGSFYSEGNSNLTDTLENVVWKSSYFGNNDAGYCQPLADESNTEPQIRLEFNNGIIYQEYKLDSYCLSDFYFKDFERKIKNIKYNGELKGYDNLKVEKSDCQTFKFSGYGTDYELVYKKQDLFKKESTFEYRFEAGVCLMEYKPLEFDKFSCKAAKLEFNEDEIAREDFNIRDYTPEGKAFRSCLDSLGIDDFYDPIRTYSDLYQSFPSFIDYSPSEPLF